MTFLHTLPTYTCPGLPAYKINTVYNHRGYRKRKKLQQIFTKLLRLLNGESKHTIIQPEKPD